MGGWKDKRKKNVQKMLFLFSPLLCYLSPDGVSSLQLKAMWGVELTTYQSLLQTAPESNQNQSM